MAVNVDHDEMRTLLNKQLLAAARQDGNVEELLTNSEHRDEEDNFLFDINCTDTFGNTPLHLAYVHLPRPDFKFKFPLVSHHFASSNSVISESIENVNLFIEADGCDVDPQNSAGDTPLHLAVKIPDRGTRHEIVSALVEIAGAVDSIRLSNKAGQTPNALAKIYCPNDTEVISLTTPPARQVYEILGKDDYASDGGDGPGSESE